VTATSRIIETNQGNLGVLYGPAIRGPEAEALILKGVPFGKVLGKEWLWPNCSSREDAQKKANYIKHMWSIDPTYEPTVDDQRKQLTTPNIVNLPKYVQQHDRLVKAIFDEDTRTLLKAMIRDLRKTLQQMSDKL
jgi:hypothetical protein